MKAIELRKKSVQELKEEMIALLSELFNLRMQKTTRQSKKTDLFRKAKKNVARVKTILSEKEGLL
jgi:large subunit ribosomal protein L29